MPPAIGKSKPKGKEGRQSRSRNTTPSSSISVPLTTPSHTAFLDIPFANLLVPSDISYDSVLDRHGGGTGIPDPTNLETIASDLKTLAKLAGARSDANNKGMRELSEKRKLARDEERDRERELARLEAEEARRSIKREEEDEKERQKIKRKEKSAVREERPLAVGAHGVARQDGLDLPLEGTLHLLVCL